MTTALVFGTMLIGAAVFLAAVPHRDFIAPAYAEEEEYEEEEAEERNEDEEDENEPESLRIKSVPTYKNVFVTKIITTLDPQFTTDQDGDKLVDGLDPHLTIPESEFFTDNDDDSVPNAFDMHPDEDDFAYYETEYDANGNGILDSYESLEER